MDTTKLESSGISVSSKIEEAEKAIKGGFIAAMLSLAMTLIITVLGGLGVTDMGIGADWFMLIDVGIIAACAIGLWFKSRTAATIMFLYFLSSKIIIWSTGNFSGGIMGVLFLFFYGRAMVGSFRYHTLFNKNAHRTDVF